MRTPGLLVLCLALPCLAGTPQLVSPVADGEPAVIGASCPTFSWTLEPEAAGYEVVVYAVEEEAARRLDPDAWIGEPVLRRRLPRGANVWVPAGRGCLAPGLYGWAVRTLDGPGVGGWSEPSLFHVAGGVETIAPQELGWPVPPVETRVRAESTTSPAISTDGAISAAGMIHSTSGGFMFPNDTVQRTAFNLRLYYAGVQGNGTKINGNVAGVSRIHVGRYNVDLGASAVGCVAVVTRGSNGASGSTYAVDHGSVSVPAPEGNNLIQVRTTDGDFDWVDTNFLFLAVCPPPLILLPPF